MELRFRTLVAGHRRWRDLDLMVLAARSEQVSRWVPPPWAEPARSAVPRGETETWSRVYVQAPDLFRVEHGDHVWVARAGRWWSWGGGLPIRGEGYVDGHLELERLAHLLDPGHTPMGWAGQGGDTRVEPAADGRYNRRRTRLLGGRPFEVSELVDPVLDGPIDPALFQAPDLPYAGQDDLVLQDLALDEAARRLPFALFALDPGAVPDSPLKGGGVVVITAPEPYANLTYGNRRRRPQVRFEIRQSPAAAPAPDRWEEYTGRRGRRWLRAVLQRGGTEIEVFSLYGREVTEAVVRSLARVD